MDDDAVSSAAATSAADELAAAASRAPAPEGVPGAGAKSPADAASPAAVGPAPDNLAAAANMAPAAARVPGAGTDSPATAVEAVAVSQAASAASAELALSPGEPQTAAQAPLAAGAEVLAERVAPGAAEEKQDRATTAAEEAVWVKEWPPAASAGLRRQLVKEGNQPRAVAGEGQPAVNLQEPYAATDGQAAASAVAVVAGGPATLGMEGGDDQEVSAVVERERQAAMEPKQDVPFLAAAPVQAAAPFEAQQRDVDADAMWARGRAADAPASAWDVGHQQPKEVEGQAAGKEVKEQQHDAVESRGSGAAAMLPADVGSEQQWEVEGQTAEEQEEPQPQQQQQAVGVRGLGAAAAGSAVLAAAAAATAGTAAVGAAAVGTGAVGTAAAGTAAVGTADQAAGLAAAGHQQEAAGGDQRMAAGDTAALSPAEVGGMAVSACADAAPEAARCGRAAANGLADTAIGTFPAEQLVAVPADGEVTDSAAAEQLVVVPAADDEVARLLARAHTQSRWGWSRGWGICGLCLLWFHPFVPQSREGMDGCLTWQSGQGESCSVCARQADERLCCRVHQPALCHTTKHSLLPFACDTRRVKSAWAFGMHGSERPKDPTLPCSQDIASLCLMPQGQAVRQHIAPYVRNSSSHPRGHPTYHPVAPPAGPTTSDLCIVPPQIPAAARLTPLPASPTPSLSPRPPRSAACLTTR